jgi:hypothetical protein
LQTKTGQIITIESIGQKPGLHKVYNYEVEGEHHFFVGETGVLVHNTYNGVIEGDAQGGNIIENAANGRAFEQKGLRYLQDIQNNVADQVSIRPLTESGDLASFRVRLDALGTDDAGTIRLFDFKSSETAGFSPNQRVGYPLLQQFGGVVVGNNGLPWYRPGIVIPPTPVTIIRPGGF